MIDMLDASARGAWRDLEARLRPFVARRLRSPADVDDVLQDVFLRMQHGLAGLRDEARFGPWVYQVVRNAIAEHGRRAARHPLADRPFVDQAAPDAEHDGERVEEDLAAHVAPFVAMLPSPYREVLTLTELEGRPHKEAAAMLGISLPAMKSRVLRGRARLRELLEACCAIALDVRGNVVACEPRPNGPVACECGGERPPESRSRT